MKYGLVTITIRASATIHIIILRETNPRGIVSELQKEIGKRKENRDWIQEITYRKNEAARRARYIGLHHKIVLQGNFNAAT